MAAPFALAAGIFVGIGSVLGIAPARDIVTKYLYQFFPTAIPQHPELVEMLFRKLLTQPDFLLYMRQNGYNEEWTERLQYNSFQLLNAMDLITLKRRQKIDGKDYIEYMDKLKIQTEDINRLELVTEYYPPPADLIRFAVREIYNPTIREAFGMDEDWPERFGTEAAKVAIPEQLARDFWAAHWDLPSIRQGYEMLHRGVITEDELDLLMKALDIMPGWRKPLKDISYTPFTRVDVRRMYGLGVLESADVTKAYKDIGYNEEKAEKMTDFTVRYENETNIGLTRASIVSSYIKGIIEMPDLEGMLKQIGLPDEIVSFWVGYADFERTTNMFEDWLSTNIKLYAEGVVDWNEINARLNAQNLDATYIDIIKSKADLAKLKATKMPSKADLAKWMIAGKINESQFSIKMLELGYREEDIKTYLQIVIEGIEPQ